MVWFSCEDCGDSIKKPKLMQHFNQCSAGRLTCLDCNRTLDRTGAKAHNSCVTEHEKYALGATKPGGKAASGFYSDDAAARQAVAAPAGIPDTSFLASRPPWTCSVCNVTCTSQETLMGHAGGAKHQRRAKAAKAAEAGAVTPVEKPVAISMSAPAPANELQKQTEDNDASHKSKKRKVAEPAPEASAAVNGSASKAPKWSFDWEALAATILQYEGGLKVAELQRRILEDAGVPKKGSAAAKKEMLREWQNSSKFFVCGGSISLNEYDDDDGADD